MTPNNFREKVNFIWQVADDTLRVRGAFKAHEYGDVILPYEIRDGVDLDSFRLQETYSGSIELEKEQGVIPGFGDGTLYNTEDEKDLLSHIITTLNETYGINLTEDDKVDIQRIRTKLEADESLRAVLNADNPRDAKVYKFNQVLDRLLLEFVHTKLDLYKKLTEPKVNEMLKRQWFEVLASGMSDQDAIQGGY